MGIECGWRAERGQSWERGWDEDTDGRIEMAGWVDLAPVCGRRVQAILGTRAVRPALDWLAWGLRVGVGIIMGGVQEESMGLVDASLV